MDQATTALPSRSFTVPPATTLDRLQPYVLSILRIVVGLLFLEHGMSRLFGFPSPIPTPAPLTMYWFAGCIEFAGGILVTLGLFTRPGSLHHVGAKWHPPISSATRHADFFRFSIVATARSSTASSSFIWFSPARDR